MDSKFSLALFAYSGVTPETSDCLIRDLRGFRNAMYLRVSNDALIDRSRSRAASDFLRNGEEDYGDVLVMIDHDMVWAPGDIEYLLAKCRETEGIVAGVYPKRAFGQGIAVRFKDPGTYKMGQDVLVPAVFVSTGFFAVHRKVLAAIADTMPFTLGNFWGFFCPIPDFEGTILGTYEYLSEDWAVCHRAAKLGFPVDAAMKPNLRHIGVHGYRMTDATAVLPPERAVEFKVKDIPNVPAIYDLNKDLAEYLDIAPDMLHRECTEGRMELAELWHKHGDWENELSWYQREDVGKAYIKDLVDWQVSIAEQIVSETEDIHDKRVLDYGAGIGTWGLLLANQGCQVDMYEPNEEMTKFAQWRAEKLPSSDLSIWGVDIWGSGDPARGDHNMYEVIVCWHVLEHTKGYQALAQELADKLAPGGVLITDSDFHQDPLHPMHHNSADPQAIWKAAGLEQVSAFRWAKT